MFQLVFVLRGVIDFYPDFAFLCSNEIPLVQSFRPTDDAIVINVYLLIFDISLVLVKIRVIAFYCRLFLIM